MKWIPAIVVACLLAVGTDAPAAGLETPTPDGIEFFEKKIRPLLVEKCQKCHGADRQKGGLRLDSREAAFKGGETGPVIIAGHPEKSELVRAVNYEADGFQMPPTGKLDPDSIAVLTDWVRRGAPWPTSATGADAKPASSKFNFAERAKHWAFQPLHSKKPPRVANRSWADNPIDCFLASRLSDAGLQPASPADRRTLLRRVTFDLTGLPPTASEIDAFLADNSATAFERVVERLLSSPHYGVRWGRHWLDLVRFAETYGHEYDFDIPAAWPYRDYVVRAFNEDVPYNDFVTEHVAGDLLRAPRRNLHGGANESIMGTAFWWFGQGKHSPVDIRDEQCDTVDNQVDVFGKTFLGLTIACARCHDHKFDPIRTQDYYALAGFLKSSRRQVAFAADQRPIEQFAQCRSAETTRFRQLVAASLTARLATTWPSRLGRDEATDTATERDETLLPWRSLSSLGSGAPFVTRRRELANDLRRRSDDSRRQSARAIVFEDFANPDLAGWQVSGPAFGKRTSRAGDFVPGVREDRPIAEFAPHGAAHSGLISGRLRGSIRSRNFTIDKHYILYRAARHQAGRVKPRALKAGQLNLIVDGFQMIRDPLYGHLSLSVANDAPIDWYVQDVSKLRGERAYIEITDEDDGWIVVDSILFSDDPHPPALPTNRLIGKLLDDESIQTPQRLAARYRQLFQETLDLWKSNRLASDPDAADRVAILNSICRQPFEPLDKDTAHGLAAILARWDGQQASFAPIERVVAMVDGTPENEHVLIRGNHKKPAEEVPRRFLEVFGGHAISSAVPDSGRLQLAADMTGPAAPLVARVIVNRLWQHHFGRGLVARPDDFGKMGQPPTHPELLDDLAAELIRSGWSIKHMQRLMVLSSAYRMASRDGDARSATVDPDNLLLHRMPVVRLEAEAIRDAILAASGRLNERLEGPSVPVYLDDYMTGRGRPLVSGPLDGYGRRSLYLAVRRNFLNPMFLAFDYPATGTTVGRRGTSNVPAQALALLNNPFVAEQCNVWAKHATAGDTRLAQPTTEASLVEALYETAFSRQPSHAEKMAAERFLSEQGRDRAAADPWAACSDLCHVLVNVKEFIYIE